MSCTFSSLLYDSVFEALLAPIHFHDTSPGISVILLEFSNSRHSRMVDMGQQSLPFVA